MEKIVLSIIIVNYNTKDLLRRCLESIHKANIDFKYEVIVVDNGSGDGSAGMVKREFKKAKVLESKENVGFSKGNNLGIKEAKGEYILLLNSDTVVFKNTLKGMLDFMRKNKKAGVATCRVELEDGVLDKACHRGFPTAWNAFCFYLGLERLFGKSKMFSGYHLGYLNLDEVHQIDSPTGAFYLIRRKILDQVGVLDEDYFMYGEDLDLSFRVKKAGWKIYYVPDYKIIHYKKRSGRKAKDRKLKKKIDEYFYETMKLFYKKHYEDKYPKIVLWFVFLAVDVKKNLARMFS